jgi:cytochrome c biogenesis protein CcdA
MLGRTLAYLALAAIIVASIMSIPDLSFFLQHYMNRFLGPILFVVGIFLLGLIRISLPSRGISTRMQDRVGRYGVWGGAVLGVIFALSFCPVSAALFFGSLIPLSVKHQSSVLLPSLFGVGTALPVILFAFAIGFSTRLVSLAFNKLTIIEKWVRRITGVIFIIVGIYYTLIYIFEIPI